MKVQITFEVELTETQWHIDHGMTLDMVDNNGITLMARNALFESIERAFIDRATVMTGRRYVDQTSTDGIIKVDRYPVKTRTIKD